MGGFVSLSLRVGDEEVPHRARSEVMLGVEASMVYPARMKGVYPQVRTGETDKSGVKNRTKRRKYKDVNVEDHGDGDESSRDAHRTSRITQTHEHEQLERVYTTHAILRAKTTTKQRTSSSCRHDQLTPSLSLIPSFPRVMP